MNLNQHSPCGDAAPTMPDSGPAPPWSFADPRRMAALLGECDVHLWLMPLELVRHRHDALTAVLDASERERAARFHFERDRRRFEAAHGWLRELLGHYVGRPGHTLTFDLSAQGKPSLFVAESAGIRFNLSHSGEHALIGLTRHLELGVDVEQVRPMTDLDAIARANFSRTEVDALSSIDASRRTDAFFACWTCKEAYVKAIGGGLSIALDGFETVVDPQEAPSLLSIEGCVDEGAKWTLWRQRGGPDLWCAAAVRESRAKVHAFRANTGA